MKLFLFSIEVVLFQFHIKLAIHSTLRGGDGIKKTFICLTEIFTSEKSGYTKEGVEDYGGPFHSSGTK